MSHRVNRPSLILIPFILAASLLIVPSIPLAHAATGLVCVATGGAATSCPGSPPTIANLAAGSNVTISVFIQNSDPMGGYDIYVKTDNTILNPVSAQFGPLIPTRFASIRCINNISVEGTCTLGTANGQGVVEMSTIESSGQNECLGQPTCSGLAFNITYNVVSGSGTTPINYPKSTGCTSSTTDPTDCVLVFDNVGNTLSENIQAATYGAAAVAPSLVSVVNGIDGQIYWSPFVSGAWGAWQSLGGNSPSPPTLCASSATSTELVVRGVEGAIYHRTFSGTSWSASWDKNPTGTTIDQPACVVLGTTLHVAVRGATGEIFATTFDLSAHTWAASWTDLNGFSPSAPALAASSSANRVDLVVRGTNDLIYHKAFTGGAWAAAWDTSNRLPIPDKTVATPAIVDDGSSMHIVVVGEESSLYYASLTFTGTWSAYTNLQGSTPITPSLIIDASNALHLVVLGFDQHVYAKSKPSAGAFDATWSSAGGIVKNKPAAVMLGTSVAVVATGFDSRLWYNTQSGTTWAGWVNMNGASAQSPGLSTP